MQDKAETNNKDKGELGESIATKFLEGLGYSIVKRNFHFGREAELDIIARDRDTLVFVEVKYRSNKNYGDPLLSITPAKQKKIRMAARGYLYVNKIDDCDCRFDVITIDATGESNLINHIINAM
jgi:putative endonuclease